MIHININQIKCLNEIKKMIKLGKRKFEDRKDTNYLEDLLEIGITVDEAWNQILTLNNNFYFADPKPSYKTDGKSLLFKKNINGIKVYIKLRIESNEKDEFVAVCLSFHKDRGGII